MKIKHKVFDIHLDNFRKTIESIYIDAWIMEVSEINHYVKRQRSEEKNIMFSEHIETEHMYPYYWLDKQE